MGTLLKCACCGWETLAKVIPGNPHIEIHDRRHGMVHTLNLTLSEMVDLLDPMGTTYQRVNGNGSAH